MKGRATALFAGLIFALGLGLSGMTNPNNILAFFDVLGDWDPSLGFVMAGALTVHIMFVLIAKRRATPLFAARFAWPSSTDIDAPLVIGSILFGLGWGLAGYCPGPAIVSLVTLSPGLLVFVASMAVGMSISRWLLARLRAANALA